MRSPSARARLSPFAGFPEHLAVWWGQEPSILPIVAVILTHLLPKLTTYHFNNRTLIVVTHKHRRFCESLAAETSPGLLLEQPMNKKQRRRFFMPCYASRRNRQKQSLRCSLRTISSLMTKNSCRTSVTGGDRKVGVPADKIDLGQQSDSWNCECESRVL